MEGAERAGGRPLEDRAQREFRAETCPDPGDQPRGEQGVAAQGEEVVVRLHRGDTQQVRHERRHLLFPRDDGRGGWGGRLHPVPECGAGRRGATHGRLQGTTARSGGTALMKRSGGGRPVRARGPGSVQSRLLGWRGTGCCPVRVRTAGGTSLHACAGHCPGSGRGSASGVLRKHGAVRGDRRPVVGQQPRRVVQSAAPTERSLTRGKGPTRMFLPTSLMEDVRNGVPTARTVVPCPYLVRMYIQLRCHTQLL